jgi:hypothetical protein
MRWMVIYEFEVPGEAFNLSSTVILNYPDHGHHGSLSLREKIPMVEPGLEPVTS